MSPAVPPICILDDEPSVLRSIKRLLESDGIDALGFERAGDFLAHAREHEVKLAVLDVRLVDGDGLEVQAELRRISPGTRVIVMSGRVRTGLQESVLQQGGSAFLLKPFEDEVFLAHVRRALTN